MANSVGCDQILTQDIENTFRDETVAARITKIGHTTRKLRQKQY